MHTHTAGDTLAILFSPLLVPPSPLLLPLCWECVCTQQWAEVFVVSTGHDGFNYVKTNNNGERDSIARKIISLTDYPVYSLHSSSSRRVANAPASFVYRVYIRAEEAADGAMLVHFIRNTCWNVFCYWHVRGHFCSIRKYQFESRQTASVLRDSSIRVEIRYLNIIPVSVPRVASLLLVQSFRGLISLASFVSLRHLVSMHSSSRFNRMEKGYWTMT